MRRRTNLRVTAIGALLVSAGCASILDIAPDPIITVPPEPSADASLPEIVGEAGSPRRLRVFVTSSKSGGDLRTRAMPFSGISGSDDQCATAAQNAGLVGRWMAWIDIPDSPALSRLHAEGPWYLPDNVSVAFASRSALYGPPNVEVDIDELGRKVSHEDRVWTGTSHGCETCAQWTSAGIATDGGFGGGGRDGGALGGGFGMVGATSTAWTTAASCLPCTTYAHLYCFEY